MSATNLSPAVINAELAPAAAPIQIVLPPVLFARLPEFTRECVTHMDAHLAAGGGFACLAGLGLLILRAQTGHRTGGDQRSKRHDVVLIGTWADYVQGEIGLHVKKAERCMRLARGYLRAKAQIDPHDWPTLPEALREAVVRAVPEMTAGQTQLDLFRELFLSAPPAPAGGDTSGGSTLLDDEHRHLLAASNERKRWPEWFHDLGDYGLERKTFHYLDPDELEAFDALLLDLRREISAALKGKTKGGAAK